MSIALQRVLLEFTLKQEANATRVLRRLRRARPNTSRKFEFPANRKRSRTSDWPYPGDLLGYTELLVFVSPGPPVLVVV
jgi:hypothetical protein